MRESASGITGQRRGHRASGLAFTQAAALSLAGVLEILCGNPAGALALADEAASVCREGGFAYWQAMASAVRGQAQVLGGHIHEGLDELARARTALGATGAQVFSTHILAFLADAYRRIGTLAEARAAVDEGAVAESSLDRTSSQNYGAQGQILLAMAAPPRDRATRRHPAPPARLAGGRTLSVRALESARASRARSLELRAATSLARVWHTHGSSTDARAMLAKVCRGFAPHDGTSDIRTARLLLDALSQSPRKPRHPSPLQPGRRISASSAKAFRT
jgi:adenylate cyclase